MHSTADDFSVPAAAMEQPIDYLPAAHFIEGYLHARY